MRYEQSRRPNILGLGHLDLHASVLTFENQKLQIQIIKVRRKDPLSSGISQIVA